MSATFATPVAAVLLAVELLLFEWKPRSVIPVALASATAGGGAALHSGARSAVSGAAAHALHRPARRWRVVSLAGLLAGGSFVRC